MNTTTKAPFLDEVSELLISSLTDVFSTMFNLEVQPVPPCDLRDGSGQLVAGSIGFSGDVNGVVYTRVSAVFARTLAGRMLGLNEEEIEGDEMVNDVIGELANMTVGGVKSHLCDRGFPCVLTIPTVVRGRELRAEAVGSAQPRLLGFRCGEEHLLVELVMKSAD